MAILAILKSGAVGSALGWIGGAIQKHQDLQVRKVELAFEEKKFAHDLELRRVDIEIMDREIAGKERIASIEAEGKVSVAQLDAIADGYKTQFTGSGRVDAFSRLIRPIVTVYFVLTSTILTYLIFKSAIDSGVQFTQQQWHDWVSYVLEWIFFQSGVVIGWWFAMRASGAHPKPPKR